MFSTLFEWWSEQTPWLLYGVALGLYGLAAIAYFGFDRIWWWPIAAGTALLIFGWPLGLRKTGLPLLSQAKK